MYMYVPAYLYKDSGKPLKLEISKQNGLTVESVRCTGS